KKTREPIREGVKSVKTINKDGLFCVNDTVVPLYGPTVDDRTDTSSIKRYTYLNATCVNTYTCAFLTDAFMDSLANAGLYVVVGFSKEEIKNGTYKKWMEKHYNATYQHRAIAMVKPFNELNFELLSNPGLVGANSVQEALRKYPGVLNYYSTEMHKINPNAIVFGVNADMPTPDQVKIASDLDGWALNYYHGYDIRSFPRKWGVLCQQVGKRIPFFFNEYGIDSLKIVRCTRKNLVFLISKASLKGRLIRWLNSGAAAWVNF
ncbi:MAG: hypothetical protein NT079_00630, partial [Candidatus Omnitrophica bacterium]|nr:hypothetical protein [Candidatus Omnitrophota bacterium]